MVRVPFVSIFTYYEKDYRAVECVFTDWHLSGKMSISVKMQEYPQHIIFYLSPFSAAYICTGYDTQCGILLANATEWLGAASLVMRSSGQSPCYAHKQAAPQKG